MNQEPNRFDVIVVGAGPAGLMTALCAARAGARVLVLEQRPEAGTRLLATGGGHCNFTNTLGTDDFIRRFGAQARFVTPTLRALPSDRLRHFFEELGVPSHSPDGFHVLPADDSARSVRDALLQACIRQGVTVRYNSRVSGLRVGPPIELTLSGETASPPFDVAADRVVLAAGGASYPKLGGGESGYRLARLAGHTIIPPCPALVPLIAQESWPGTLSGLTLPRVTLRLANPDLPRAVEIETGSLLFTHKGISGPVALNISGRVARALTTGQAKSPGTPGFPTQPAEQPSNCPGVTLQIDLIPDLTPDAWDRQIGQARKDHGARAVLSLLRPLLPAALADIVLDLAALSSADRIADLSRAASQKLLQQIKGLTLTITATEGFGKAMAAKGGIHLGEVNPKTLESKLVSGLFFAGEILDIDGPCGGFNLQWAFASGFIAAH
jgi:hypothetical protein